jgi:phosphoribosylanthranilate isomerase
VKVCGITSVRDAVAAVAAGADAIGVVLYSDSPRSVPPERAAAIFAAAGPFVTAVAVTASGDAGDLDRILTAKPDAVQVPADAEVPGYAGVKVIRMLEPGDPLRSDCDAVVVDGSRGRGRTFDPVYARRCVEQSFVPVILAGGLTPENVREAIGLVRPYAVDVSSGVESSPGVKDHRRVREFIGACREAVR